MEYSVFLFIFDILNHSNMVLEKATATHSSTLAWRIPWIEGAWRAAIYGVTQSWT